MAEPVLAACSPAQIPDSVNYSTMEDDSSDISDLSSPPASPHPPPGFYPSPPPSQDHEERSQDDKPPPRKRRRVEPKPRTTAHLDLTDRTEPSYARQQAQIDLLVKTLRKHRKIVVIAGAGISTSAGSRSSMLSPLASCSLTTR